jgi:hypothetical protein
MDLKTRNPLLKFDPSQEAIVQSLSAALFVGEHLWVASDESTSLERLSIEDGQTFHKHRSFPLNELISLPATGTDFDQEIDIEGLDFRDSHLWLVGSHSLKRKKVESADMGADEKLIKKLGKVEREGNRFILARIPLISVGNEQELKSPAVDPSGSAPLLKAAAAPGDLVGNALTDAIRKADNGKGDLHLARFLDIPGKDNGFDIEGLAVVRESIFLGLRGPVLRGWAMILELAIEVNDLSELTLRESEVTGRPYRKHFLDLKGLGVRELCFDGEDLFILAGPTMNLDGPAEIYRWKNPAKHKGDSFVRSPDLEHVVDLPFGQGKDQGKDHPEGFTIIPGTRTPPQCLVVYDSPSEERTIEGPGTVRVDVFELAR